MKSSRTPREVVALATDYDMLFSPGERFSYSNTNYIVLGLIIEEVTHQPVELALEQRVLKPTGMTASSMRISRVREPPIAHGYDGSKDVTQVDLNVPWTAGGMVSTVDDVSRFFQSLFGGTLVATQTVAVMTRDAVDPTKETGSGYGLGIARQPFTCGMALGHSGRIDGFSTEAWTLVDGQRSVVVVENDERLHRATTPSRTRRSATEGRPLTGWAAWTSRPSGGC